MNSTEAGNIVHKKSFAQQVLLFALFSAGLCALYYEAIAEWAAFSRKSELYSYSFIIPFVSGYILLRKRRIIAQEMVCSYLWGSREGHVHCQQEAHRCFKARGQVNEIDLHGSTNS